MFKKFICLSFIVMCLAGCLKNSVQSPDPPPDPCIYDACAIKAPDTEIQEVKAYLAANNITASQHCSGVFYSVEDTGTGKKPDVCTYIVATYTGKLVNGNIFDKGTFRQPIRLGELVRGWTNALPLIKQGGTINLYIPPTLGYGSQAYGTIPANSILIFNVKLDAVL
jgi:FKBP-type peptidyl-prolyl cis-trans isomerase FkpA